MPGRLDFGYDSCNNNPAQAPHIEEWRYAMSPGKGKERAEVKGESTYWDVLSSLVAKMRREQRKRFAERLLKPEELDKIKTWKVSEKL